MRAFIERYFKPRQMFVAGDESIDLATIGHSAAASCYFKLPRPDIPIDMEDLFMWPPFRAHVCIFEGLVDVIVIEEGNVIDNAAVVGIGLQAQIFAGQKGAVGKKGASCVVVVRSGMAKLRFFSLDADLPMSRPEQREFTVRG